MSSKETPRLSVVGQSTGNEVPISRARAILLSAQDEILKLALATSNQQERLPLIQVARELGDLQSTDRAHSPCPF